MVPTFNTCNYINTFYVKQFMLLSAGPPVDYNSRVCLHGCHVALYCAFLLWIQQGYKFLRLVHCRQARCIFLHLKGVP
jgi:hypothetical protein